MTSPRACVRGNTRGRSGRSRGLRARVPWKSGEDGDAGGDVRDAPPDDVSVRARHAARARARVESVATNARRARVRGERRRRRRRGAERRGRDALDVRCGLGPGAGLRGRALALEAFSPRERGASQAQARRHQRGVGKRRVRRRIRRRTGRAGEQFAERFAGRHASEFSLDEAPFDGFDAFDGFESVDAFGRYERRHERRYER